MTDFAVSNPSKSFGKCSTDLMVALILLYISLQIKGSGEISFSSHTVIKMTSGLTIEPHRDSLIYKAIVTTTCW